MPDPGQFCPPFDGAGLLHLLYFLFTPLSHVLEQVDQLPQEPQLPFLVTGKYFIYFGLSN